MKKVFGILVLLFCTGSISSFAQTSKTRLRISVLTCSPGDELYSLFGHTALRITDSAGNTDFIYNYGTFDFEDPDLYTKFVRGKLNYFLSIENIRDFLYQYRMTNRSVIEQELLLSDTVKLAIAQAVAKNLEGTNRYYKYDFLYDNCTSRVRDLLIHYAGMSVNKKLAPEGTSFRDMIHEYADKGRMAWTKLGMDIILGVPADKKVTINESMFLPDYLMKGIDSSLYSARPVLLKKQTLLYMPAIDERGSNNGPVYFLSIIALAGLVISFVKTNTTKTITYMVDRFLFLLTGCIGLLLLLLWFGTDHAAFGHNYNLLWAIPTNIIPAFVSPRKPGWLKKYFLISAVVYALLLVSWYWLPQQLNIALIPMVIFLLIRTIRLVKN